MPLYIAMLRGINVGGHNRIKMDKLRKSIETLGFERVKTYIQSGNVLFETAKTSPATLSNQIEGTILSRFGFSISVVIRTEDELRDAIENNPLLNRRGVDPEKLHVTFLSERLTPAALGKLKSLTIAPDQSHCAGKEIFLYLPNGVSESSLMKVPLDRTLGVVSTTRNWRTVSTLRQMCEDCR